jgi:hypothetical protein
MASHGVGAAPGGAQSARSGPGCGSAGHALFEVLGGEDDPPAPANPPMGVTARPVLAGRLGGGWRPPIVSSGPDRPEREPVLMAKTGGSSGRSSGRPEDSASGWRCGRRPELANLGRPKPVPSLVRASATSVSAVHPARSHVSPCSARRSGCRPPRVFTAVVDTAEHRQHSPTEGKGRRQYEAWPAGS